MPSRMLPFLLLPQKASRFKFNFDAFLFLNVQESCFAFYLFSHIAAVAVLHTCDLDPDF